MKLIFVTGANKGIGYALIQKICSYSSDTIAILGVRDKDRGKVALQQLIKEHPEWKNRLYLIVCDVASDQSVQLAKKEIENVIKKVETPLYGIVNNAGVASSLLKAKDIININTYGPNRVIDALIPLLDQNGGRIVNISSGAAPMHVSGCVANDQLIFTQPKSFDVLDRFVNDFVSEHGNVIDGGGLHCAYGFSKACLSAYTILYAKKYPFLTINACTPGYIQTDMTMPISINKQASPEELGMKRPDQGTIAPMHLLMNELTGNGYFYGSDAKRSPLDQYRSPGSPAYTGQ